jgi:dihydroorotase
MTAELKMAVLDGTVDCIATHHLPHEFDSKVLEFEYARFGMTGLETSYGMLKTAIPEITEEKCIGLLSVNPREIFGLPSCNIQKGNDAQMSLFLPGESWVPDEKRMKSKARNTPMIGIELRGRPLGIINGDKSFFND